MDVTLDPRYVFDTLNVEKGIQMEEFMMAMLTANISALFCS